MGSEDRQAKLERLSSVQYVNYTKGNNRFFAGTPRTARQAFGADFGEGEGEGPWWIWVLGGILVGLNLVLWVGVGIW